MYPIRTPSDGYAVYIHVPFCNRRCHYCDFYLRTDPERKLPGYYPAINAEIALYGIGSDAVAKNSSHPFAEVFQTGMPSSLFIGGGTPSLLNPERVADWITFWRTRGLPESAEVTLEANPEDRARYRAYAAAGINRLSIGCQSFHDDELQQLGRTHTRNDIEAAFLSA
ncbi:MAG: radical SAM protein, partial [bacterium]|nr:radical SAM protein [bacterium]